MNERNFHPWVKADQANRPLPPKTLCILFYMVYAPYASMELKYGILSLLISETLHQSETSRIN